MAATESEHLHHGVAHAEGHGGVSGGHYPGMWVFPNPRVMTRDMADKIAAMPRMFTLGLLLSFGLLVLGVVGFVARATADGFDDRAPWGYYMATFSFVFMVTSAAPVAAVAFRFTKSHWRRPLSRVSELFAVVGIFNIITFIPMMMIFPAHTQSEPGPGSRPRDPADHLVRRPDRRPPRLGLCRHHRSGGYCPVHPVALGRPRHG